MLSFIQYLIGAEQLALDACLAALFNIDYTDNKDNIIIQYNIIQHNTYTGLHTYVYSVTSGSTKDIKSQIKYYFDT